MEYIGFLFRQNYKDNIKEIFKGNNIFNDEIKKELESVLNIKINNIEIFEQAFLHSSFAGIKKDVISNERLEYLGDAVLEFIISDFLFTKYKNKPEGELTEIRSRLVKRETLVRVAENLEIKKFMILSYGAKKELLSKKTDSILANVVEAIIAAIYIDSGLDKAANFIYCNIINVFSETIQTDENYKKQLQELLHSYNFDTPIYQLLYETGADHDKVFQIGVYINNIFLGSGKGSSKKIAAQHAAKDAIDNFSLSKLLK